MRQGIEEFLLQCTEFLIRIRARQHNGKPELVEAASRCGAKTADGASRRRRLAQAGCEIAADLGQYLVSELLAKDPGDRPPNAGTLGRMLRASTEEKKPWTPGDADSWWRTHHPEQEEFPKDEEAGDEARERIAAAGLKRCRDKGYSYDVEMARVIRIARSIREEGGGRE